MQLNSLIAVIVLLISSSFYPAFASEVINSCANSACIQGSVDCVDEYTKLQKWINEPKNLEFLVSDAANLTYLMKYSYKKFSILMPFVLEYFNNKCSIYFEEVSIEAGVSFLWTPIQQAILQNASIEDLENIFCCDKWEKLYALNKSSDLIERILTCSKRSCFLTGQLDEQKKEADVLVKTGILGAEFPGSILQMFIMSSTSESKIPEVLLKALFTSYNISVNTPRKAGWLAENFAWDLVDEALLNIDLVTVPCDVWLSILMSSAHQGWEKFETMYANVLVEACSKWMVFCKSLSYSSLEWFSDRLISENENIKNNINTVDGHAALVVYSSGNDKFLKQVLGDASFLKYLEDNFNDILNRNLPDKVLTALLNSLDFKNLVKEKILDDQAWNEFATALCPNIQKAKLIYGCFLLKPDSSQLDILSGAVKNYHEGLAFLSEKFWDVYTKETKVKVLQVFIEHDSAKPLINVLARENTHKFKLSELLTNHTIGRFKILELVSFFDCVEVDCFASQLPYPNVKLDLNSQKGIKESRKNLPIIRSLMKGRKFNAWFYSWAAKYCLFHNDFNLMVELGRHMLLEDPQDQVISYAEVALKMAIFKLAPILVEDVRLLICHFHFQDARDSMNLQK